MPGPALGVGDTAKNRNEQKSLPWWNLHFNVKRQMANNKQDKHIRRCVRR